MEALMTQLATKRSRLIVLGLGAAVAMVAASLGMAVPAGAASEGVSEGVVAAEGGPTSISGSYIVALKDDVTTQSVEDQATGLAAHFGGQVTHTYSSALHGFAVSMNATQARRLAADPAVASVEQDQTVTISGVQSPTPSWGLDRIDQRYLPLNNSYTYPNTASNVHAYIIDTGILITHTDFGGRASVGTDTVGDGRNGIDCNGHGTHVSGTVGGAKYGVAKAVRLHAVRVLDCSGSGTYAGVIAGVDWVTAHAIKPAVANMSLGGGFSQALNNAVTRSMNSGVTYALAAGNSNANACSYSPSSTPGALTAGATDSGDNRAYFSNYGTCVALFAPGVSITSDWNTSNTATNTISGTSMASPHVAGAAALYLSANPSSSASQVRSALVGKATPGVVKSPGPGSPNKLLFVS
jgi:subtilisin family serine protease